MIRSDERHFTLFSGKQIDFVSLAICSCVLTLLCHSMTDLPQSSASSRPSAQAPSSTSTGTASTVAFKPYTLPSSRPEIESEDEV